MNCWFPFRINKRLAVNLYIFETALYKIFSDTGLYSELVI